MNFNIKDLAHIRMTMTIMVSFLVALALVPAVFATTDVTGAPVGSATTANYHIGHRILATESGSLATLGINWFDLTAGNFYIGIYADNGAGTSPTTLLAQSASTAMSGSTGFQNISVTGVNIIAGNYYWIAIITSTTRAWVTDGVTKTDYHNFGAGFAPLVNTWTIHDYTGDTFASINVLMTYTGYIGPQWSTNTTKYATPVISDPSMIHGFQIGWNGAGGFFNTTNVTFQANFSGSMTNYTNSTTPALFNQSANTFVINFTNAQFLGEAYFEYKWFAANGTSTDAVWNSTSSIGYIVSNVAVGLCNATLATPSVTFAFFNETTDFSPINATVEIVFTNNYGALTFNASTTNETYAICISPALANSTLDGHIRYTNSSYSQRDYWFEHMIFDSAHDYKNLYLLNSNIGSRIKFIVKDEYTTPYPDVIINIQRYYPSLYEYRTVAAPKTDTSGETITYLTPYDVYYRYVLTKNGVTLHTSKPTLISASEITISVEPGVLLDWLKYGSRMTGSCAYDAVTSNVTCAYADMSGYMTGTALEVKQIGALISSVVCSNTSTSIPTGHISCHFGNASNFIYKYTLTASIDTGETFVITDGMLNEGSLTTQLFGNCGSIANIGSCREGLIIAFFMTLTAALVGIYNPPISIAFMMVVVGVTWYIGLLAISIEVLIGLLLVATVIIVRLSRGEK